MQTPETRSYEDGIHAIDTGFIRPGLAASFLLVRDGRAALVDTGIGRSSGSNVRPGRRKGCDGVFCNANITWKIGV